MSSPPDPPDDAAPPPGIVVREARPRDARSYADVWRSVVEERVFIRTERPNRPVRWFRHAFRRSRTDEGVWLVAVEGARVVGGLHAAREEGEAVRHVASIGMFVVSDMRGRGIGAALLAACVRWGRDTGVEKLALSVYPHNEAAIALYRRFGFQEEGRMTGHSKKNGIGYLDEVVMGRWLARPPPPPRLP